MRLSGAERQRRHRAKQATERAEGPMIICACGCGSLIRAINTNGLPALYKHGHNPHGEATRFQPGVIPSKRWREWRTTQRGANHPAWHGGMWKARGYVRVTLIPEEAKQHPTALHHGGGWSIMRSHLVWNSDHPGDPVYPGEEVHHINRIRDDDDIANLEKKPRIEHRRWHAQVDPRPRDTLGRFMHN